MSGPFQNPETIHHQFPEKIHEKKINFFNIAEEAALFKFEVEENLLNLNPRFEFGQS